MTITAAPDTALESAISMIDRLVGYDTISSKSNLALIDDIEAWVNDQGIETRRTWNSDRTKANLWFTLGPKDRGGVIISGHVDVVPVEGQDWQTDPFSVVRKDGKLFGRGTTDMKGFVATALSLVPKIRRRELKTPIHFAITYDEEVGCLGVRELIADVTANLPMPRAAIVGEPTLMKIINGHKGGRSLRTTVHGVAGHSSEPHRGANAIMAAAHIIVELQKIQAELQASADPDNGFDPPFSTIGIGIIRGGTARNIIPGTCWFDWEVRSLPGFDVDAVEQRVRDFCAREIDPGLKAVSPEAGVEITRNTNVPALIPTDDADSDRLIRQLTGLNQAGCVPFGTEAGLFQSAGIPATVFGPGAIQQAHQPNEFVEISQITECITFLGKLIDWAEADG